MTCKLWKCRILGHNWSEKCNYRVFSQTFNGDNTNYQLRCNRSNRWVTVSRKEFSRYFDEYCRGVSLVPTIMSVEEATKSDDMEEEENGWKLDLL